MTVDRTNPRAKPRWLALFTLVVGLTAAVGVGLASAAIPAGYTVVIDEHGANDVPGQVDVTQMGVMASESPDLRIFWSWDSTSAWTGSGQTGDASALFDTGGAGGDADAFINYVVCARVQNLNADPNFVQILPSATNKPVYIFDCSNKKFDRCTNPSPRTYTAGQVVAGPFNTLSQTGVGNLINNSDPFNASALNGPGESYPNDSSIDIRILSALVPAGVKMVNVCSYPSAGNGGNNNPFDCIRTPGAGTLIVNKTLINDNGGTAAVTSFNFTVGSGASTTGVLASTAFEADASNSVSVTEGTYSVAEVGTPIAGYTTSYSNCTSVTVVAGGTATCTITNNDNAPSLTLVKNVTNDNGGTALPAAWTLTATGYDAASPDAGTYNLSESGGPAGYTQTSLTCSDTGAAQVTSVTLSLGESVTCTFVNNDNIASPGIGTTMSWTLHDSAQLSGFVSGGGASTITFTLYKDTALLSSCEDATIVDSANVAVNDVTGFASTAGFLVTEPGTYRWIASFSGNTFNAAVDSDCNDEVSTISVP